MVAIPSATTEVILPSNPGENDDVNLTDDTVEEVVSTTDVAPIVAVKKHNMGLKPALKSQPTLTRLTPMVGKNDPNLGDMGKSSETPSASGSRLQFTHSKACLCIIFVFIINATN